MLKHIRPIAGVALWATLTGAPAQAEDLLQIYRQMLESEPQLKAAVETREATQEEKIQARALYLPKAEVSFDQRRTFDVKGPTSTPQSYDSHTYTAAISQPLYNRSHGVQQRVADIAIGNAEVEFQNTYSEALLRTANAYFSLLLGLDNLTFVTAAKNAFARQLEQANRRFEVGLATITDVYDAQASFDSAVSEEVSAMNELANARETLRQLTNREYTEVSTLGAKMPLALPSPNDPEAWVKTALEHNLKLRSTAYQVDKARESIELQKSAHYPTAALNVSRSNSGTDDTDTSGTQVVFNVRVPLYSGGSTSSETRQAAHTYESARQTQEAIQRDVIRTVRNAYRSQETAISQIKALEQMRISTRSALEANRAGYEVGTRTIVDVLNAERNVYQAEANYAKARYTYVVSLLTLRQAAGQLEEKDILEINGWLDKARPTDGSPVFVQEAPKVPEKAPEKTVEKDKTAESDATTKKDADTKPTKKRRAKTRL